MKFRRLKSTSELDAMLAKRNRALTQRQSRATKRIAQKVYNSKTEWKHHDASATFTASYSGNVQDVSIIPQGDGDTERIGDNINAYSLSLRMDMSNADDTNLYRVVVFQWLASTTPTPSDILTDTSTVYACLSQYINDKVGKGKSALILYDKTFALNAPYSGGVEHKVAYKKIKLRRRKIQYQTGGTTGVGKVYILAISDSAATSHPALLFDCRLHYTD